MHLIRCRARFLNRSRSKLSLFQEAILNQPRKLPSFEAMNSGRVSTSKSIPSPRFSLSQITTYRSTWEEDLRGLDTSSFGTLGVWLSKLDEHEHELFRDRLRKSETSVSSVSFVGGFTGVNGVTYQEALNEAYRTMFFASSIGARCVVVTPGARGKYSAKHERRLVAGAIRELACLGKELGVDLALLPMRPEFAKAWTFLHSIEDARSLLADVGHPRAGLALDSFQHLNSEDDLAMFGEIARDVRHVQLSDAMSGPRREYERRLPGDGELPLQGFVDALMAHGYRGYFDIQVWSREVWSQSHESIVQQCSDWLESALSPYAAEALV